MSKKYIYVLLTQTLTTSGKIIRKATGSKYSHASISLDKDLNEMYSFARFKYHTPLVAGFTKESITSLGVGHDEVNVKVFRIPVKQSQYDKIERTLEYFKNHAKRYKYNLFNLIFYLTPIEFNIKDSYICTEFVSKILASANIKKKKLWKNRISPNEMIEILHEYEYYSGPLGDYDKTINHHSYEPEFLEKENFFIMCAKSAKQIGILLFRKII